MKTLFKLVLSPFTLVLGLLLISLFTIVLSPTDIWRAFSQILAAMYLRPLLPWSRQSTTDAKSHGVKVQFICEKDEYKKVREAANKAGLWFKKVELVEMTAKTMYTVWIVQDRRTMS